MVNDKKKPRGKAAASASNTTSNNYKKKYTPKKAAENPFDKFANAKKKHEVLNRKVKGEDRNIGRARGKAIDERKKKLLKDMYQSKKGNVLIDKRFGEDDPTMSLEEKMFLRFQNEKLKKLRKSSIYNLNDDDENDGGDGNEKSGLKLTHKGQVLGESNINDLNEFSDDDDEDENGNKDKGQLSKDVVNKLHFGGGFVPKTSSLLAEDGGDTSDKPVRKGRLEALQEIVMKSKFYKAQRRELKEEQETERERLDKAFEDLFAANVIDIADDQINRRNRRSLIDNDITDGNGADAYDRSMNEMLNEKKVQPTDRTKTAEELALEMKEKLQELEKARLKRMKEINDGENEEEEETTGKASKKRVWNDDMIDNFGDVDNYGTKGKLKRRQDESDNDDDQDDDDQEEEEDDDEMLADDDSDDDSDEEEEGDEEDDEDEEEDNDDDAVVDEDDEDNDDAPEDNDDDSEGNGNSDDEEEEEAEVEETLNPREKKKLLRMRVQVEKHLTMPHDLPCAQTLEEFEELLQQYVLQDDHQLAETESEIEKLKELLHRIISWNSVHLPGVEGTENKKKMHNFLVILLKYFVLLGDQLPPYTKGEDESTTTNGKILTQQLDILTQYIYQITQDLQEKSSSPVSLYFRTTKQFYKHFLKLTRDYSIAKQSTTWLSTGHLLFFQLIRHIFSVSDLKHDYMDVVKLILCQLLAQCPVNTSSDLVSGLFVCGILLEYTEENKKIIPEVWTFLYNALQIFDLKHSSIPSTATNTATNKKKASTTATAEAPMSDNKVLTFNYQAFKHWRYKLSTVQQQKQKKSSTQPPVVHGLQWKYFCHLDNHQEYDNDSNEIEAILRTIYALIDQLVNRFSTSGDTTSSSRTTIGFPTMIENILNTLQSLRPHQQIVIPSSLQELHLNLLTKTLTCKQEIEKTRQPLTWRTVTKLATMIESKTPRYEMNYTFKKDVDPDTERVKLKQLTRQLKREKKAAMRELRRDATFIDAERYKQQQEVKEARRDERVKNFAWMEDQQASINLQVKSGKSLMKGGGSAVGKRPRVKR